MSSTTSTSTSSSSFPRRIFAECYSNGRMPHHVELVVQTLVARARSSASSPLSSSSTAAAAAASDLIPPSPCSLREIEAIKLQIEEIGGALDSISVHDLAVGNPKFMRRALDKLRIPSVHQEPRDYPDCLRHLLHRNMWTSTLGALKNMFDPQKGPSPSPIPSPPPSRIFVKPAAEAKAFNGECVGRDELDLWLQIWRETLPASFPVHCSEVVDDIVAEWRAYVVDGEVKAICQYMGAPESLALLDEDVIKSAARLLYASPDERLRGCGMDFAVARRPSNRAIASSTTSEGVGVRGIGGEGEGGGGKEERSGQISEFVTILVEVNDGINTGAYEGVEGKVFADMVVARWEQLMSFIS